MPVLGSSGVQTDAITAITATPAFDGTAARFANYQSGLFFWGYAADGDYVLAASTTITYYNSAGTLQWTVNATDFNASATGFGAICKEGSYIYAVATQISATAAWIAKIDSSGTVSDITSITMLGTSSTYKDYAYNWIGVPHGESDIYLVGGNFTSTSFNPSTLATVTTCATSYVGASFLTSKLQGIYLVDARNSTYGMYSVMALYGPSLTRSTNYPAQRIASEKFGSPFYNGISATNIIKFFYWDGYIIGGSSTILGTNSKAYTAADFDSFANNFLLEAGAYRDCTGDWS